MKLRVASISRMALLFILAAAIALSGAGAAAAAGELADGTYSAQFEVRKPDDDSVSIANDYWQKPAEVIVKDGKYTIRMTVTKSDWITEFKVESNGSYSDTKVVSSSKTDNTRTVEFAAADIASPVFSKIHVIVPEINYNHGYTIRFVFDASSVKLIKAAATPSTAPSVAPSTAPSTAPSAAPTAAPPSQAPEATAAATDNGASKGEKATEAPEATAVQETGKPSPTAGEASSDSGTAAEASPLPSAEGGDDAIDQAEATASAGEEANANEQDSAESGVQLASGEAVQEPTEPTSSAALEEQSSGKAGLIAGIAVAVVLLLGGLYVWAVKSGLSKKNK